MIGRERKKSTFSCVISIITKHNGFSIGFEFYVIVISDFQVTRLATFEDNCQQTVSSTMAED
jgi:hypothetical protein